MKCFVRHTVDLQRRNWYNKIIKFQIGGVFKKNKLLAGCISAVLAAGCLTYAAMDTAPYAVREAYAAEFQTDASGYPLYIGWATTTVRSRRRKAAQYWHIWNLRWMQISGRPNIWKSMWWARPASLIPTAIHSQRITAPDMSRWSRKNMNKRNFAAAKTTTVTVVSVSMKIAFWQLKMFWQFWSQYNNLKTALPLGLIFRRGCCY